MIYSIHNIHTVEITFGNITLQPEEYWDFYNSQDGMNLIDEVMIAETDLFALFSANQARYCEDLVVKNTFAFQSAEVFLTSLKQRSEARYAGQLLVAKSGGDFDSIQAAIDSITDATNESPWCIRVMPGTYNEDVELKDHVDLQGIGGQLAAINGSLSWPAATCTDGNWSSLDNITVQLSEAWQDTTIVNIEAGWHYLTNCWIYGAGVGCSFRLITQSGGWADYLLTAIEYEHTGDSVVGAGLDHVCIHHTGGLFDVFYSELYMATECTLQNIVAIKQAGNAHSLEDMNRFAYAPISIYAPSGFTGYAAVVDVTGDSNNVHINSSHIILLGAGNTGDGYVYRVAVAGIGIESSANVIKVSEFEHNYFASAAAGSTVSSSDRMDAADGFTGAGSYNFNNSQSPGNFSLSGSLSVGGTVDGRNVATDGSKLDLIAAGATNTPLATGAPSNVTKAAAEVGVSTDAARADHKHDVATATVSGVGAANAEGSSTSLARADHVHAHGSHSAGTDHAAVTETVNGFMAFADKLKLDAVASGATNTPLTATAPANVTKAAAAAGVATDAARSDHKHDVATATPSSVGSANSEGSATSLSRSDHVHNHGDQGGGSTHSAATTSENGFFTGTEKTKLNGIADNANNYSHPTGDGNLHVPANSTTNAGKVLTASGTAGVYTWETPGASGGGSKTLNAVFGDGNAAGSIIAGLKTYVVFPVAGTITGWRIISNAAINAVVDVWKANGAIPTVANTIAASAKPTLTGATVASGSPTGWTTSVAAGDIFGFNLDSFSGSPTQISVVVEVTL